MCTCHVSLCMCVRYMLSKHDTRTEKCSDICQHTIKLVLTFTKNDQTLVEICTVALYFVRLNWDLYRSTLKVLGKCLMSDCYFTLGISI